MSASPASLGFRMPAEWEPHEATWLSWPHKLESWPGAFEEIPGIFVEMVRFLAESERVRINVADDAMAAEVRGLLKKGGVDLTPISFHFNPTNDAWCRDHGPIYVVRDQHGRRERAITDWKYNAWGGKYPPYDLDDAIPVRIAAEFDELRFEGGMVLEGGSIDVNGTGSLLTSEACLLNPNRNPELDREQIEQRLRDYFGVTNILWLGDGIVGDDTDGHIDDLTRFVSQDTIVTMVEPNTSEENHPLLEDNLKRLQSMKTEDGKPLKIVTLPMPDAVMFQDQRLPASYANFYIANRRVLVPVYGCKQDNIVLETLQRLFPDRLVLGINCTPLVWGLGAIHCVSQQQPEGVPVSPQGF